VIVGVSRDDCLTHAAFPRQNGLSILLLPIPKASLRLHDVLQQKTRRRRASAWCARRS
jgi:hypothetical protein